jgi:hypothetical protein
MAFLCEGCEVLGWLLATEELGIFTGNPGNHPNQGRTPVQPCLRERGEQSYLGVSELLKQMLQMARHGGVCL